MYGIDENLVYRQDFQGKESYIKGCEDRDCSHERPKNPELNSIVLSLLL